MDLLADAEGAEPAAGELAALLATTGVTDTLRGALLNRNGELARIWERLSGTKVENPEAWLEIEHIVVRGGLDADGGFAATVNLDVADPETAPLYAAVVETAVGERFDNLPFEATIRSDAAGGVIRLDFLVPDFAEALTAWLKETGPTNGRDPVRIRQLD